jgi:hypothetical protein
MAPEEILSSVDPSRREFLKKVIAGTTFAVPLMASFSMEGLSVESAWASNVTSNQPLCANMPEGSPCCTRAVQIAGLIGVISFEVVQVLGGGFDGVVGFEILGRYVGFDGGGVGASPEVIAALLGPLAKAQSDMTEGVRIGKGTCDNPPALDQFRKAARDVAKFKQRVIELCGADNELSQELLQVGDTLIGLIGDLVAGNCSSPI